MVVSMAFVDSLSSSGNCCSSTLRTLEYVGSTGDSVTDSQYVNATPPLGNACVSGVDDRPSRIIPEAGQILQNDPKAPAEEVIYVFDENVLGMALRDDASVVAPKARSGSCNSSCVWVSSADVLARESACDDPRLKAWVKLFDVSMNDAGFEVLA
jgi:hypothetical protein